MKKLLNSIIAGSLVALGLLLFVVGMWLFVTYPLVVTPLWFVLVGWIIVETWNIKFF